MIVDIRSLQHNTEISADICIVGAGVAGITIARELANRGFTLALLESGGLTYEEDTQALYTGNCSTEAPYIHQLLEETRRRQFGGTAQRWNVALGSQGGGVRYVPLAEVDFEKRAQVPHSGWPLSRHDLDPFYARAHKHCGLGTYDYDPASWATREQDALPFRSSHVETSMFHFGSRTVFTKAFQEQVRTSRDLTLYLHANLVAVDTDAGSTIERAHVKTLEGKHITVRATQFVLAAGGIENARLLLATAEGRRFALGNEHDLVGRYFMDHPLVRGGEFHPASPNLFARMALYDICNLNGSWVMGHLTLSKEVLRQTLALNTSMLLYPRHANYQQRHVPNPRERRAVDSARYLGKTIKNHRLPQNPFEHIKQIGVGLNGVVSALQQRYISDESTIDKGGWSQFSHLERRFSLCEIYHQTEQTPHRDSRVTLDDDRDALGMRKARLDWLWSERDILGIQEAQKVFASAIAKSGLGRFDIADDNGRPQLIYGCHHHMGTTRMDATPAQGVVDVNSKVYGTNNLFVAGSSVFPTAGYQNPTLTIVALAVRLADHLTEQQQARDGITPIAAPQGVDELVHGL